MFLTMIRNKKGLTVAELLVVIAIMATMAAIGTPAIVGQLSHIRLKRSARDVLTELNGARMNAISKNTKYRVEFTLNASPTVDTYRIAVFDKTTLSWGPDPSRSPVEVSPSIDITAPGANFNVEFLPNGTATAQAICLQNTTKASDKLKVNIFSSTGRTEIQSGC